MSEKYSFNSEDLKKIATALLFSMSAAVVSTLIVIVGDMDFGNYAFLIPLVNAGLYSAKKFLEGPAV